MKKVLLSSVLLVSMFQISCSDDDDGASEGNNVPVEAEGNNAPDEAVLEISQESGLSIDLVWNQVIDPDGDNVTYDLFANDEIVEADLETVDYVWSAEGRENVEYPVVFKVVSKDSNEGESTSNEVMLDDPIIGVWINTFVAERFDDGGLGEFQDVKSFGVCNDTEDSLTFLNDNNLVFDSYDTDDGVTCFLKTITGKWENKGSQNYSFDIVNENGEDEIVEMFFIFEGNTFNFVTSDSSWIYERE